MFNRALKLIFENEQVELFEKSTTVKRGGATSVSWQSKGNILCNIQADSSFGNNLNNSEAGDKVKAVYNLYTRIPIKEGMRIKRDDFYYEIRDVEHNGYHTILEHYKGKLARVSQ